MRERELRSRAEGNGQWALEPVYHLDNHFTLRSVVGGREGNLKDRHCNCVGFAECSSNHTRMASWLLGLAYKLPKSGSTLLVSLTPSHH